MRTLYKLFVVTAVLSMEMPGQVIYTDKGHWLGLCAGYVPSGDNVAVSARYDYRFDKYWSGAFDLTGLNVSKGFALIIAAGLRMRIPIIKYGTNIYGQVGFGSGSMYPVLMGAVGAEYALVEGVSLFAQYRRYTANFDDLRPQYAIYSLGINIDVTPVTVRQSYLL